VAHVLALEPDRRLASLLSLVYEAVGRRPVIVARAEDAIAAIDRRVPTLVLVNALIPPTEEARLLAHLRAIPRSVSVQILVTPFFQTALAEPEPAALGDVLKLRPRRSVWARAYTAFADQLREAAERGGRSAAMQALGERRSSARVASVDRARIAFNDLDVELVDLSLTGMQVVSASVHVPGTVVPVTIGDGWRTADAEALVVWGAFEIRPSTQAPQYRAGLAWKTADEPLLQSLCGSQALARLAPAAVAQYRRAG